MPMSRTLTILAATGLLTAAAGCGHGKHAAASTGSAPTTGSSSTAAASSSASAFPTSDAASSSVTSHQVGTQLWIQLSRIAALDPDQTSQAKPGQKLVQVEIIGSTTATDTQTGTNGDPVQLLAGPSNGPMPVDAAAMAAAAGTEYTNTGTQTFRAGQQKTLVYAFDVPAADLSKLTVAVNFGLPGEQPFTFTDAQTRL